MFNEALRAEEASRNSIRNPETRATLYAESKRAWARWEAASKACNDCSDKIINDCKQRCAFIDARAETRAKRAVFAQAIGQGMEQVYKRAAVMAGRKNVSPR